MAPTNEERKKVAKSLRDAIGRHEIQDAVGVLKTLTLGQRVIDAMRRSLAMRGVLANSVMPAGCDDENEILGAIADLIEPQQIDEDTSDGYHTFRQLYFQRMMLFAVLVAEHRDLAWKTHRHEDGEPCFGGGWFLVTIETPAGAYGYHYEDKYWDLFNCEELPKAKPWDGYDESDVWRLMSLASKGDGAKNGD